MRKFLICCAVGIPAALALWLLFPMVEPVIICTLVVLIVCPMVYRRRRERRLKCGCQNDLEHAARKWLKANAPALPATQERVEEVMGKIISGQISYDSSYPGLQRPRNTSR